MAAADLLQALGEVAAAVTLALLAVLMLRRPLRALAGPCVAYALWLLVPVAALAVLLPAKTVTLPKAEATTAAVVHLATAPTDAAAAFDPSPMLLVVWACGALVTAAGLLGQQRAFHRRLGRLRRRGDGAWQAEAVAGLPAVLGVWRPRVLVPADFEARYSALQRRLMLVHERTHIRRADLYCNALAALLRCLLWFHPLMHFAVGRFRHDQELACDARIVARHPRSRRAYGEAMLKTQLAAQALPLGCHWAYGHPLKERIVMLNTRPAPLRRVAGAVLVAGLVGAGAFAAWAEQPARVLAADPQQATLDIVVRFDGGEPITSTGRGPLGGVQRNSFQHGGQRWDLETTLARRDDGTYEIRSTVRRDGTVVAQPRLVAALRTPAKVAIGEGEPGSAAFKGIEIEYTLASEPAGTVAADLPMPEATRQSRLDNAPVYPPEALQKGIGGTVVLLVDVGADGVPTHVQVERAEPAGVFDAAAIEAVRRWRFMPETQDGKPVAGRVRVPITFEPSVAAAPRG